VNIVYAVFSLPDSELEACTLVMCSCSIKGQAILVIFFNRETEAVGEEEEEVAGPEVVNECSGTTT